MTSMTGQSTDRRQDDFRGPPFGMGQWIAPRAVDPWPDIDNA